MYPSSFASQPFEYPLRRVTQDDNNMKSLKHGLALSKDDGRASKKTRNN